MARTPIVRRRRRLFNPGPSWHVEASGDFNGDSKSDILWQHSDGAAAIWLMDGTNVTRSPPSAVQSGAELARRGQRRLRRRRQVRHFVARQRRHACDLADGRHDPVSAGVVGSFNPGPSWQVEGTGDFNGDGKSDILWQHDGTPAIWLMDGTTPSPSAPSAPSIRGRAGRSRAPAISTAMASPTSCGRARRHAGDLDDGWDQRRWASRARSIRAPCGMLSSRGELAGFRGGDIAGPSHLTGRLVDGGRNLCDPPAETRASFMAWS